MLLDQLKAEMTAAMKSGDKTKLSTLRMLVSEAGYKQIDLHRDLTEDEVIGVIRTAVKRRKEAIDSYTAGGRPEQAAAEAAEMEILQQYLPVLLSEDEIRAQATDLKELEEVNDIGSAMKIAGPVFKGRADMGLVAKIVKEKLALPLP